MHQRHRGLNDEQAIQLAIQPCVSGTFGPGKKGKAKFTATNAGLGLHVLRSIAGTANGHLSIVSNRGVLQVDAAGEENSFVPPSRWAGTAICLTYKPSGSDSTMTVIQDALTRGAKPDRKREPFSFQPAGDPSASVKMTPTFGGLIEDKEQANKHREEHLLPAIKSGQQVQIDLTAGSMMAHSCAHALIYEIVVSQALTHAR